MNKNNKNRNVILRLTELAKNKIVIRHSVREHSVLLSEIFTDFEIKRKNNPEANCGS